MDTCQGLYLDTYDRFGVFSNLLRTTIENDSSFISRTALSNAVLLAFMSASTYMYVCVFHWSELQLALLKKLYR